MTADPTLTELLADHDAHKARLVERAQLANAELQVLSLYDSERHYLGHDYGNGQRARELGRVRREHERALENVRVYRLEAHATAEQLTDAYRRLAVERTRRQARGSATPENALRAVTAWRAVAAELARITEARRALGLEPSRDEQMAQRAARRTEWETAGKPQHDCRDTLEQQLGGAYACAVCGAGGIAPRPAA